MTQTDRQIEQAYNQTKEIFAEVGLDADIALRRLAMTLPPL
jgi:L-rhamnose isomerase